MYPPSNPSEQAFRDSLKETIAWCRPRVDLSRPAECLRSEELRSAFPNVRLNDGYRQNQQQLENLIQLRRNLVVSSQTSTQYRGRLISCEVYSSEASGASALDSKGYFDSCDVPPWDTWVAWFPDVTGSDGDIGFLIAWVPEAFHALATCGIDACPLECIFWADDPSASGWETSRFRESIPDWYLERFVIPQSTN